MSRVGDGCMYSLRVLSAFCAPGVAYGSPILARDRRYGSRLGRLQCRRQRYSGARLAVWQGMLMVRGREELMSAVWRWGERCQRAAIVKEAGAGFWHGRGNAKSPAIGRAFQNLAVRKGFEPLIRFHVYTLSRRAPSTTRTPHQIVSATACGVAMGANVGKSRRGVNTIFS